MSQSAFQLDASARAMALDYDRIERAILFLEAHFLEQPDLAAVARSVHLSEYHFQRLFTRWAGVSPKRFQQFLTVEYAKRRLDESKSVLDATYDSGLSSPSRLHDLFVSVEAVTPGEFKTRGAGIEIAYGLHPTPFGECLLGLAPRGVCWLSFVEASNPTKSIAELKDQWRGSSLAEKPERTAPLSARIFSPFNAKISRPLSLLLMGTNFQIQVWRALLRVPAGALITYEKIGGLLGRAHSARAIGSAVGNNRIAYLIPCHRVIRKSGVLGEYRWGATRKRAILGWEAARTAQAQPKERNLQAA